MGKSIRDIPDNIVRVLNMLSSLSLDEQVVVTKTMILGTISYVSPRQVEDLIGEYRALLNDDVITQAMKVAVEVAENLVETSCQICNSKMLVNRDELDMVNICFKCKGLE